MNPVPLALQETSWAAWLQTAPLVLIDTSGDAYFETARNWLANAPGHNANLSLTEFEALLNWVTRYQLQLNSAKQGTGSLGEDRLIMPFASLIGAMGGTAIATKLGLAALASASVIVASGLALLGIGLATRSILTDSIKLRRGRMLQQVIDGLDSILLDRKP